MRGGVRHLVDKIKSDSVHYAAGETAIPFDQLNEVNTNVYEFTIDFGTTFDSPPAVFVSDRTWFTNFNLISTGIRTVVRTVRTNCVICRYYDSTDKNLIVSNPDWHLYVNWLAIEKGIKS